MKIIGLAAMAVSGMVTVGLLSLTAAAASTEDAVKRDEETAALVLTTDDDDDDTTGTGVTGVTGTGVTKTGVTKTGDTTGFGRDGRKAGAAVPQQGKQGVQDKAMGQPKPQAGGAASGTAPGVGHDTTDTSHDVTYDDGDSYSADDSGSWS